MADNVLWVEERERDRGKVLYFAHDEHVETGLGMLGAPGHPPPGQYQQIRSAGRYLRSALGSDLLVIGTYLGHGEGFGFSDDPAPAVHSMEDLLGSVTVPQFLMNLHELPTSGPLREWLQTAHATRSTILRDATDSVAPLASYDDIFFTRTVFTIVSTAQVARRKSESASPTKQNQSSQVALWEVRNECEEETGRPRVTEMHTKAADQGG